MQRWASPQFSTCSVFVVDEVEDASAWCVNLHDCLLGCRDSEP